MNLRDGRAKLGEASGAVGDNAIEFEIFEFPQGCRDQIGFVSQANGRSCRSRIPMSGIE